MKIYDHLTIALGELGVKEIAGVMSNDRISEYLRTVNMRADDEIRAIPPPLPRFAARPAFLVRIRGLSYVCDPQGFLQDHDHMLGLSTKQSGIFRAQEAFEILPLVVRE